MSSKPRRRTPRTPRNSRGQAATLATATALADLAAPLMVSPAVALSSHGAGLTASAYDAAGEWRGRRRPPHQSPQSEDALLPLPARDRVTAAGRDLNRNFALTAWMIRRHLDYCATFELHATHEDQPLGDDLEQFFAAAMKADQFDRAGRHDFDRYLRITEARAVVDGDFLSVFLDDGTTQGCETDRLRNPYQFAAADVVDIPGGTAWHNGVYCDHAAKALAYQIHSRTRFGYTPEALIPAHFCHLHGYYDRYDQVRGISPITGALASFRDCQEAIDLALAKAKVSQLFALAIMRNADSAPAPLQSTSTTPTGRKRYDVDFGRGPVMLDLEPGDEAKFLGDNTPSTSFQEFLQSVLVIALKALDIPYSFYDESHTNFFGSRGAWLHYERAAMNKRKQLLALIDAWKRWRLWHAIQSRAWRPPSGYTLEQLTGPLQFVPVGMPWWKPTEELKGDLDAIGAGLSNPEKVARQRSGGDVYENLRITARVKDYAAGLGIAVNFAPTPAPVLLDTANADH